MKADVLLTSPADEVSRQIIGIVRRDALIGYSEYRSILEDLKSLARSIASMSPRRRRRLGRIHRSLLERHPLATGASIEEQLQNYSTFWTGSRASASSTATSSSYSPGTSKASRARKTSSSSTSGSSSPSWIRRSWPCSGSSIMSARTSSNAQWTVPIIPSRRHDRHGRDQPGFRRFGHGRPLPLPDQAGREVRRRRHTEQSRTSRRLQSNGQGHGGHRQARRTPPPS